jgi:hypothetical protein
MVVAPREEVDKKKKGDGNKPPPPPPPGSTASNTSGFPGLEPEVQGGSLLSKSHTANAPMKAELSEDSKIKLETFCFKLNSYVLFFFCFSLAKEVITLQARLETLKKTYESSEKTAIPTKSDVYTLFEFI